VVTGAHGDTLLIQQQTQILLVHAIDAEGHQTDAAGCA
jgi:hypothetical protein